MESLVEANLRIEQKADEVLRTELIHKHKETDNNKKDEARKYKPRYGAVDVRKLKKSDVAMISLFRAENVRHIEIQE